jgi:hypothetical protein
MDCNICKLFQGTSSRLNDSIDLPFARVNIGEIVNGGLQALQYLWYNNSTRWRFSRVSRLVVDSDAITGSRSTAKPVCPIRSGRFTA